MNNGKTFFMPEAVSTIAPHVDSLFYFIYWVSVFFFVVIVALLAIFVIRYRRRSEHETTPRFTHSTALEIGWTIGPVILIVIMFLWGFDRYMEMRVSPHGAMDINVTAQKWSWTFTYPDGTVTSELGVPVNQPVRLIMESQDVIHSFFVPSFRIKMDVLPNRYTTTWFEATEVGEYPIFCTEYCGTGHSAMLSTVKVMSEGDFDEWLMSGGLGDTSQMPLVDLGAMLYKKLQCHTCHAIDGSVKVGPSFKGIYGHDAKLADGRTVPVDENYIRKSIVDPNSDIVAGFSPAMPSYKGRLDERQFQAMIAYIKSLE